MMLATTTSGGPAAALAQHQQHLKAGKGKVKAAGGQGGPEHIYREPRVAPRAAQISQACVTTDVSRSRIKPMSQHKDYQTTVAKLFEYAANQCRDQVNAIIAQCQKTKKPFFDQHFYYDSRLTMYPKGSPTDCTVTEPRQCMRASQIMPGCPLFQNGVASGDIVQGAIGDCFFIGAVSALASCTAQHLKPIERLFVAYSVEHGVYGVLFFKDGGWEWVIVDDWVAVNPDKTPLYASAPNGELWPLIIEKAYAKVHNAFDTIDGGWGREALADMSGGLEFTLDLYNANKGLNFGDFKKISDNVMTVLGCGVGQHVQPAGGRGRAGEAGAVYGLFKGHAYSVLEVRQTSDGQGFVRVRNPWGNSAEWNGPYGDRSPEWKRNPLHMKELNPEFKDDGAFWMKWDDFKRYFTDIDVMEYFDYSWHVMSMFGSSVNNFLQPGNTFILDVKAPIRVVLSLVQEDPKVMPDHGKAKSTPYAVIRLSIWRIKSLPSNYKDLQGVLDWKVETSKIYNRAVDEDLQLEAGLYSVVPQFFDSPEGKGFLVRCFAPPAANLTLWRFSNPGTKMTTMGANTSFGDAVAPPAAPVAARGGDAGVKFPPLPQQQRAGRGAGATSVPAFGASAPAAYGGGGFGGAKSANPFVPPQPSKFAPAPVAREPPAAPTKLGVLGADPKRKLREAFQKAFPARDGCLDRKGCMQACQELLTSGVFQDLFDEALRRRGGKTRLTQAEFESVFEEVLADYTTFLAASQIRR